MILITETKQCMAKHAQLRAAAGAVRDGQRALMPRLTEWRRKPDGSRDFASDEFVRGQNFRGFKVEHYSDIKARLGNFAVVIAFASELTGSY